MLISLSLSKDSNGLPKEFIWCRRHTQIWNVLDMDVFALLEKLY
jgi:hypothetical protein